MVNCLNLKMNNLFKYLKWFLKENESNQVLVLLIIFIVGLLFIIKFQQTESKQTMYEIEIINKQNDSIRQQQSIDCDKALKKCNNEKDSIILDKIKNLNEIIKEQKHINNLLKDGKWKSK